MLNKSAAKLLAKGVKTSAVQLDGDLAEVGVSVGDSAEVICKAKGNRPLHLFDTFEGHPEGYIGKYDLDQQIGKHRAEMGDVQERLKKYPNVFFYKGIFPETSGPIKDKRFCFVNLDTDLYRATYEGLEFFVPRMVLGGAIVVHDAPGIPGVICAIVDYFEKYPYTAKAINLAKGTNQAVINL